MIRVSIIDKQNKEAQYSFDDDLAAQSFALKAKAEGCSVKIMGNNK